MGSDGILGDLIWRWLVPGRFMNEMGCDASQSVLAVVCCIWWHPAGCVASRGSGRLVAEDAVILQKVDTPLGVLCRHRVKESLARRV